MRLILPLLASLSLAACVSAPQSTGSVPPPSPSAGRPVPPTSPPPPPVQGFRQPQIMQGAGLNGVIETNAATLVRQFGTPRLDVTEGDMRKLQFASSACVLDIFLYPLRPGAEPLSTWIEARRASDGAEVDRQACIQALRR